EEAHQHVAAVEDQLVARRQRCGEHPEQECGEAGVVADRKGEGDEGVEDEEERLEGPLAVHHVHAHVVAVHPERKLARVDAGVRVVRGEVNGTHAEVDKDEQAEHHTR
ncbi:hypothetical protein THAOC_23619, partial [Thalassiosira oceanica]